ncbi:MAG: hypothetical protein PVG39_25135 [Desulfobacteraceae bacterium]|jgi:hypothetical protein
MKVNNRAGYSNSVIHKNLNGEKSYRIKKLDLLIHELEALSEKSFTGYVKVNYSQGSIGRVEKFEEILKGFKVKD